MSTTTFRPAETLGSAPRMFMDGGDEGRDCLEQALGLMHFLPLDHRLILGCILLNTHDDRDGGALSWQRPWLHHTWVAAPDGTILDPALIANVEWWCEHGDSSLLRPLDQLEAVVIGDKAEAAAAITDHIANNKPHPAGADVIYLPGVVFTSSFDRDCTEITSEKAEFWAGLAQLNAKQGGWGFEDGIAFHSELPRLLLAHRNGKLPKPKRGKGKGFGKEAA